MSNCKVHNIRFYNLEPRAIHCLAYNSTTKKLGLSRSDASIEIWNLSHTPYIERTIPARVNCTVEALVWSGSHLFSSGFQGTVTEYDLHTLSAKNDVSVVAGPCWCLASNKSNTRLAAGTEDGYINIFSITEEGLQFENLLDKQEGRILCIAWDPSGDMIATGSVDAIRIWNVDTGHAVYRMTPGRTEANKETIVWCLAVAKDLTIISGDSRGRITFWDGNTGTQVESFQSHKTDILCLCLAEDEKSVYCAGVDPIIMSFVKIWVRGGTATAGTGRNKWVRSVHRRIHDHDVRALALADGKLLSAGVDSYLAISSYPPRVLVKYPPIPQNPCVTVCPEARYVMLKHATHLEVWQLGSASPVADREDAQEGDLQLVQNPVHLLTLKSRSGDSIVCADMSSNGEWIAYSTLTSLRFYYFKADSKPGIQKVPFTFNIDAVHKIKFTPDSSQVVIATVKGDILIIELSGEELFIENIFHAFEKKLLKDAVHLLTISQDGKYIIASDHESNIVVWTRAELKHHCTLPRYRCTPTAFAVQGSTNKLVIAYSDHKVVEYSLSKCKYTSFSRGLEKRHPTQWLTRGFAVNNIAFDPNNKDVIILQDDNTICVINKNKELPEAEAKIPRIGSPHSTSDSLDGSQSHPKTYTPQHAFHVIKKYKHLVHLEWLKDDELVIVEVSPLMLTEKLPPTLKVKRFGEM